MFQVTAKTSTGGVTTAGTAFTVSNAESTTRVFIDTPGPKDGAYQGLVQFAGWALDDSSGIAKVSISVDGVPYGTATYGVARPDVCAAHPGRPGCPAVGWTFLFNTGQLSNGSHTLGVTATTADGRNVTSSASFSVANWLSAPSNNAMHLDIDTPSPKSGALSGIAQLGGWAIDDNAAITSVQIAVDDVVYGNAVYGNVRTDVCNAYPKRAGCPNVGWGFFLDTTLLTDGPHTLAVTGISAGGQSSTITASFAVGNLANAGMRIDIDTPNTHAGPLSGVFAIGGWALADAAGMASIEILVNGVSVGMANYGGVRNDVCSVFTGRTGCPDVGWNFFLDTTQLSNGSHSLEVTGTTTTGERATAGTNFTVAN
jgi:large repetitive protein